MIHDDMHAGGEFHRSSNEIEADIRQTRTRMDATLEELGERLSARYILNTALDWWETRTVAARSQGGEGARVAGRIVGREIKDHPMPALLIGAGIAWLLFKDDEQKPEYRNVFRDYGSEPSPGSGSMMDHEEEQGAGVGEKMKQKATDAKETVTEAFGAIGDKVSAAAHSATEGAAHLRDAARDRAGAVGESAQQKAHEMTNRARHALYRGRYASQQLGHNIHQRYDASLDRIRHGMDEYPLAAGLGFAALGALIGLILPHTRREDELLGPQSERLVSTVKERGEELLHRGKVVAERVAETALSEAQKQGLTPESAGGALSNLAAKAGEVLQKVKEEAVAVAEEQGLAPDQLKEKAGVAKSSTQTTGNAPDLSAQRGNY